MSDVNEREVSSAPMSGVRTEGMASELDQVRQRLFELRVVLTERFDRRVWDEYVRLRRVERIAGTLK